MNKIWSKIIPFMNKWTMIISLILIFTVDFYVIVESPEFIMFWAIMFAVLGVFFIFYKLEKNKYIPKFRQQRQSRLDKWIASFVFVRNIIFILNFIPFIQLLGLATLFWGGLPMLIFYIIVIKMRNNESLENISNESDINFTPQSVETNSGGGSA